MVDGTAVGFTGTYALVVKGNLQVSGSRDLSVGVATPTARIHPAAGTVAAGTAPLKIPSGVVLAVTEAGAVEADSNHVYWTNSSGTRIQLDNSTPPTLAQAYANGSVAADQTLSLLDAKGGALVVDGTAVGFTGTYALDVRGALQIEQFGGAVSLGFDPTFFHAYEAILSVTHDHSNVVSVQNKSLGVNSFSNLTFRANDGIERGSIGHANSSCVAPFTDATFFESSYFTGSPHATPPPPLLLIQTGYLGGAYGTYVRQSFTSDGYVRTFFLDGTTLNTEVNSATGAVAIHANLAGDALSLYNANTSANTGVFMQNDNNTIRMAIGAAGSTSAAIYAGTAFVRAGSGTVLWLGNSSSEIMRLHPAQSNVSIGGIAVPTARLHLPAGTATAGTAPLKIPSGIVLSVTEAGAVEADNNHLYWTNSSGTRLQLDNSGGATITLAQSYANGSVAADQTLSLLDAKGGALIVDGTAVGFTGTYALVSKGNLQVNGTYSLSVGVATPTARLHLAAGTAAAGTAPLKIPSGVVLSVTEAGAVEADNSHLYWTNSSGTRLQLDDASVTTTLSQAYANGSVAADQTLSLLDAKGGGLVVDGTSASFTGANALALQTSLGRSALVIANAGLSASTQFLYDNTAFSTKELLLLSSTQNCNVLALRNTAATNSFSALCFRAGADNIERGAIGYGNNATPTIFNSTYIEASYFTGSPHTTPPSPFHIIQTGYMAGSYASRLRQQFSNDGFIRTYLLDGTTINLEINSSNGVFGLLSKNPASETVYVQNKDTTGYGTLVCVDATGAGKSGNRLLWVVD